MNRKPLLVHP